ncbi:MAG: glycosyltransferase [Chloroflexi bacterium]|nr:glycosyltransferase [Chloroflexota bacterium]
MKVVYFTRGQSPHDLRFLQALARTEHQVFVLCLEQMNGRSWPAGITEIQWKSTVTGQGSGSFFLMLKNLRQVISEVKPDLIHAGPIQQIAFLIALIGFQPLLTMSWGSDILLDADQNSYMRWKTRFTLKHTRVLVGDCLSVGAKSVTFGFPLNRYRMFPWGVDLAHFSPDGSASLRQKLGWEDKTVLLSNRSMEPLYGVDLVVKAFIMASKDNESLRLMLFGRGSQEKTIRKIIEDHGVVNKVYFGGFAATQDLPDIYRSADYYLSASHSDGSSVSLMEALACGLPVIVSDIPGNLEWVTENSNGWLFKDNDVTDLAKKITKAEISGDHLQRMKKQNRILAQNRADWLKNFPVLLDAYDLAINAKKEAFSE